MHKNCLCSMASRSPQVVTEQDWGHRPRVIIPHFKWLLQEEDTRPRAVLWDISDDERHQLRHLLFFQLQPQPAPHFTWHFGVMAGVSQATCTCKRVSRQHKINTSPFPHMASICPPAVPCLSSCHTKESPRAQPCFTASQHHTSAPCHRGSTKAGPSHG